MLIKIVNPNNEAAVETSLASLALLGSNAITITVDGATVKHIDSEAYYDVEGTTWNSNLTLAELTYIIDEVLKTPGVYLIPQEGVTKFKLTVNTALDSEAAGNLSITDLRNTRGSGVYMVKVEGLDASNNVVYSKTMAVYTVPECPVGLRMISATSSSLSFRWVRPLVKASMTSGAKLKVTPSLGGSEIVYTKTKAELMLSNEITADGLQPGTSYNCYLTIYNSVGESFPSVTVNATTSI